MAGLKGEKVRVQIESPNRAERELVQRVRAMALSREIVGISLAHGQLLIDLNDGGKLAINAEGGLKEVESN